MSVRIILVTKSGCGPCGQFLGGPWKTLRDDLSYGVGGTPVEHYDVVTDGLSKIPPEVRKVLNFVPQMFALYDDGKVETPKFPLNTPDGLKELQTWAKNGPPTYAATSSTIESDDDSLVNPKIQVVAVTSVGCRHCQEWEATGALQKFLDGLPKGVSSEHYNVDGDSPPKNADDMKRRLALVGIAVPAVVVVNQAKWSQPTVRDLGRGDVMLSPGDVRSSDGLARFNQWLGMLTDSKSRFLGYLVLATSPGCGYCRQWKDSGGMDAFVERNSKLPGVLLIHNGALPQPIRQQIQGFPSGFFVSADQWSSSTPAVVRPPDVRNTEQFGQWTSNLLADQGQWDNDPDYLPDDYRKAAAAREPQRVPKTQVATKRPLRRQAFH